MSNRHILHVMQIARSGALILLFALIMQEGTAMPESSLAQDSLSSVPSSAWKRLSEMRMYFGHQSVGYNILEGISAVANEQSLIRLDIVQTHDASKFTKPVFAHDWVGENRDIDSKLKAFSSHLEQGIGDNADVAMMKFCYVDITMKTDAKDVFLRYKAAIDRLKKRYPRTTFVHVTAPLTAKQTDLKTYAKNIVKSIMGKPVQSYRDNIKRTEYNDILLREYGGKEPVFDLARIESTYPDGSRSPFTEDGITFYTLVPEYTDDGGHLNERGRKIVAAALLRFLADLTHTR